MELEKIINLYEKSKIEDYRLGTELPTDIIDSEIHVEEIEAFCKILPNFFEKEYETYLSRYLTALIQQYKSKEIFLNLSLPLESFGYKLTGKKLVINGDLGDLAFMYADTCLIEIKGDVGERLGYIANECLFKISGKNIRNNPLEHARKCKLEFIKS